MHNFKELKVWRKSIDLAVEVYKATSFLPSDEKFGLISQMKRCSVSIPSNIAEGSGRGSGAQFKYFLTISQGSAFELETQLIISNRLELLNDELSASLIEKTTEIQKMLYSLDRSLKV
ncbi:four helix bundle protein [Pedobacter terrae]|uniref:four helix bundle protein n=1 Tax=Pedobacter terrae TaxID=405671 RepID=UPI002FF7B836